MKFKVDDYIVNVAPVEGLNILTPLIVRSAGNMEYYPDSTITGDGYHMTYYSWDNDKGLVYCNFYINEEQIDDRFAFYNNLTQSQITAIEREDRINKIFED